MHCDVIMIHLMSVCSFSKGQRGLFIVTNSHDVYSWPINTFFLLCGCSVLRSWSTIHLFKVCTLVSALSYNNIIITQYYFPPFWKYFCKLGKRNKRPYNCTHGMWVVWNNLSPTVTHANNCKDILLSSKMTFLLYPIFLYMINKMQNEYFFMYHLIFKHNRYIVDNHTAITKTRHNNDIFLWFVQMSNTGLLIILLTWNSSRRIGRTL